MCPLSGASKQVAHEDYAVTASKRSPLAPGWLFFALALLAMGGAWLREGK